METEAQYHEFFHKTRFVEIMNEVITYMNKWEITSHRLCKIGKTVYDFSSFYLILKSENLQNYPLPLPDSCLIAIFRNTWHAVGTKLYISGHLLIMIHFLHAVCCTFLFLYN